MDHSHHDDSVIGRTVNSPVIAEEHVPILLSQVNGFWNDFMP